MIIIFYYMRLHLNYLVYVNTVILVIIILPKKNIVGHVGINILFYLLVRY